MTERRFPNCLRCGQRIGWHRRRDALFCSEACKQAEFRRRRDTKLPLELWRKPGSLVMDENFHDELRERGVQGWGRIVYVVEYLRATRCIRCQHELPDDLVPIDQGGAGYGLILGVQKRDLGPFCSLRCLEAGFRAFLRGERVEVPGRPPPKG